jgi:hypothetical protein
MRTPGNTGSDHAQADPADSSRGGEESTMPECAIADRREEETGVMMPGRIWVL